MDARRWFKTKHLRRGFALFGNVSVNSIQAGSRKAGPPATLIASLQIRSWPKDASFADKSTAYRKGADVPDRRTATASRRSPKCVRPRLWPRNPEPKHAPLFVEIHCSHSMM